MSLTSAGLWVEFFNTAGIPSPTAATYAHLFVEHRIKKDMLVEITNEHLREMGITALGDMIAIQRHIKFLNDQSKRDTVMRDKSSSSITAPVATSGNNIVREASIVGCVKPNIKTRISETSTSGGSANRIKTGKVTKTVQLSQRRRVLVSRDGSMERSMNSDDNESSTAKNNKQTVQFLHRETIKPRSEKFNVLDEEEVEPEAMQIEHSSSIFARLGGKKNVEPDSTIKSILKKPQLIVKQFKKATVQKKPAALGTVAKHKSVILLKTVPLNDDGTKMTKKADAWKNGNDYRLNEEKSKAAVEKCVKFSATAEVREIYDVFDGQRKDNQKRYNNAGINTIDHDDDDSNDFAGDADFEDEIVAGGGKGGFNRRRRAYANNDRRGGNFGSSHKDFLGAPRRDNFNERHHDNLNVKSRFSAGKGRSVNFERSGRRLSLDNRDHERAGRGADMQAMDWQRTERVKPLHHTKKTNYFKPQNKHDAVPAKSRFVTNDLRMRLQTPAAKSTNSKSVFDRLG